MIIKSSSVVFAVLLYLSASWVTLTATEDDKSNMQIVCALNVSTHSFFGKNGVKGDPGPKGEKGDMGIQGFPGKNCRDGVDGRNGIPGTAGTPGEKGDRGPIGPTGADGKDMLGPQGEKGRIGDPGTPGTPGTCGCLRDAINLESDEVKHDHAPEWAIKPYKPGNVTCKNAPSSKETGVHYIYLGPMKINCNGSKTCVSHSNETAIEYTESEPFWLSQKGVSLEDIYNLKSDQLSWLQSESHTASLTIRYHCLNSIPYSEDSADRSVMLLSWNDMMIDHDSTTSTPFHYSVPKDTDGCSKASKTVWSSTDIILDFTTAQRLPIIDFYIRDVRKEMQSLRIEILQLCFE